MFANQDKFIQVAIRIRPTGKHHYQSILKVISNKPDTPILFVSEKQSTYSFDHIFNEESTQEDVYRELAQAHVDHVLEGYNCTIFAYGQTGTGKTYTMGSNPELISGHHAGIISRTLDDLFKRCYEDKQLRMQVSFYEIYNQKVYDLLSENSVPLPVKNFSPQGLTKEEIHDISQAYQYLSKGGSNRHTGETNQNKESSRSHSVFTIFCESKCGNEITTLAKLNLVDLAGSESVRKTGTQGSQFQESVHINQGLHCVGKVINALSCNSFVPYRESTITTTLKDSLSSNNYITLIACVSPQFEDLTETIQTLEFSQKAKRIRNKPEINNLVQKYKKENSITKRFTSNKYTPKPKSLHLDYKTPFKRPRPYMSSTTIKKPNHVNSTLLSNVGTAPEWDSSISSPISSVSTMIQDQISPVVKKYIEASEKTILAKMQDILAEIKENLPLASKNSDYDLTKIIKNQIREEMSTVKKVCKDNIRHFEGEKRCLDFSDSMGEDNNDFIPVKVISPIQSVENKLRKSVRLSRKLPFDPTSIDTSIHSSSPKNNPRRSVRLSTRVLCEPMGINITTHSPSPKFAKPAMMKKRRTTLSLKKDNIQFPVSTETLFKPRRSVRLSQIFVAKQKENDSIGDFEVTKVKTPKTKVLKPKQTSTKKRKSSLNFKPSDMERYVLDILNTGDIKQLQKLATIGPKTANQIYIYRKLHGNFNSIMDLKNLPSWRGSSFEKFLNSNFITLKE